jgi:hypothetical protein
MDKFTYMKILDSCLEQQQEQIDESLAGLVQHFFAELEPDEIRELTGLISDYIAESKAQLDVYEKQMREYADYYIGSRRPKLPHFHYYVEWH